MQYIHLNLDLNLDDLINHLISDFSNAYFTCDVDGYKPNDTDFRYDI